LVLIQASSRAPWNWSLSSLRVFAAERQWRCVIDGQADGDGDGATHGVVDEDAEGGAGAAAFEGVPGV
jgi:hypothetical protein